MSIMKKITKRKVKYQGLSLPVDLVDSIKDHVESHGSYTSVTDFIKNAIRNQIESEKRQPIRKRRGIDVKDNSDFEKRLRELEKKVDILFNENNE